MVNNSSQKKRRRRCPIPVDEELYGQFKEAASAKGYKVKSITERLIKKWLIENL